MKEKKNSSFTAETWRQFKKNKLAVAGMILIILLCFMAVFADYIAPYPYDLQDHSPHRSLPQ